MLICKENSQTYHVRRCYDIKIFYSNLIHYIFEDAKFSSVFYITEVHLITYGHMLHIVMKFSEKPGFLFCLCSIADQLQTTNQLTYSDFALHCNRFRRAFLLFLREPFGKSEPGQISTSRKNVQYKNGGLNTFQITVS